jgi:hypothetical protein
VTIANCVKAESAEIKAVRDRKWAEGKERYLEMRDFVVH